MENSPRRGVNRKQLADFLGCIFQICSWILGILDGNFPKKWPLRPPKSRPTKFQSEQQPLGSSMSLEFWPLLEFWWNFAVQNS
jgi:hypothetical protein